jgi:hypothetical protein
MIRLPHGSRGSTGVKVSVSPSIAHKYSPGPSSQRALEKVMLSPSTSNEPDPTVPARLTVYPLGRSSRVTSSPVEIVDCQVPCSSGGAVAAGAADSGVEEGAADTAGLPAGAGAEPVVSPASDGSAAEHEALMALATIVTTLVVLIGLQVR